MNRPLPLKNLFPEPASSPSHSFPVFQVPTAGNDIPAKRNRRTKLWELADKHHCPIMGTCLSISELGKFARRHFPGVDARDEYAMHVKAVNFASSHNAVSEAMHKHLERKYRLHILQFERAQNDAEVLALWREHYARGEVAGALWAATTHKAISAESEQRIFADIHMLSHQVGAGQAADARRLAFLEKTHADARAALDTQQKRHARIETTLRQQLEKAESELAALRPLKAEVTALTTRLTSLEAGTAVAGLVHRMHQLQVANDELMAGAQRAWALEKSLKAAHEEAQALASERDQLAAERDALQKLLGSDEEDPLSAGCGSDCAACDRAGSHGCVLYVGGRPSLMAQYRALAERLGIRLIHHDGGIEESLSRLPDMIHGADAVICPTDCVSHSAYYQLKRHCKRSGKPCLLFKGSGISGFAAALARVSSGQSSLNGPSEKRAHTPLFTE